MLMPAFIRLVQLPIQTKVREKYELVYFVYPFTCGFPTQVLFFPRTLVAEAASPRLRCCTLNRTAGRVVAKANKRRVKQLNPKKRRCANRRWKTVNSDFRFFFSLASVGCEHTDTLTSVLLWPSHCWILDADWSESVGSFSVIAVRLQVTGFD